MANPNPSPETRFKPGQSGNPGGRPKRPDIAALDRLIEQRNLEDEIAEVWVDRAKGNAAKGIDADFQWFKLMIEHRNGAPPRDQEDKAIDIDDLLDDGPEEGEASSPSEEVQG